MYADRRIKLRAHHRRSGAPRILTPDGSLGRACEVRLLVTGGPLGVVVGVDGARISGGTVGADHTLVGRWHCGCRLRSEEHTSELQSRFDLVCRLLLEKKTSIMTESTGRSRHRPPGRA